MTSLDAAHIVSWYIKQSRGQWIFLSATSNIQLHDLCDTIRAHCKDTHCSGTGYCIIFGASLIFWKIKKQTTVSHSLVEVEFRARAFTSCEVTWLKQLLTDLHISLTISKVVLWQQSSHLHCFKTRTYSMNKQSI